MYLPLGVKGQLVDFVGALRGGVRFWYGGIMMV